MITVAIAEDHQALIDGIESYVRHEDDIKVIGHANNGEELLKLVRLKQPKVVLCDIRMPKLDGIEATKIVLKELPYTKVVAFTMFDQEGAVEQMLAAGAHGYILKNSSLEVVLEAIRTVAAGKTYYDKKILSLLGQSIKVKGKHKTKNLALDGISSSINKSENQFDYPNRVIFEWKHRGNKLVYSYFENEDYKTHKKDSVFIPHKSFYAVSEWKRGLVIMVKVPSIK